jgi:hypothetical protein
MNFAAAGLTPAAPTETYCLPVVHDRSPQSHPMLEDAIIRGLHHPVQVFRLLFLAFFDNPGQSNANRDE